MAQDKGIHGGANGPRMIFGKRNLDWQPKGAAPAGGGVSAHNYNAMDDITSGEYEFGSSGGFDFSEPGTTSADGYELGENFEQQARLDRTKDYRRNNGQRTWGEHGDEVLPGLGSNLSHSEMENALDELRSRGDVDINDVPVYIESRGIYMSPKDVMNDAQSMMLRMEESSSTIERDTARWMRDNLFSEPVLPAAPTTPPVREKKSRGFFGFGRKRKQEQEAREEASLSARRAEAMHFIKQNRSMDQHREALNSAGGRERDFINSGEALQYLRSTRGRDYTAELDKIPDLRHQTTQEAVDRYIDEYEARKATPQGQAFGAQGKDPFADAPSPRRNQQNHQNHTTATNPFDRNR